MSATKLHWQRERALADFGSNQKSNLILVSTEKGIDHSIDDIFDDVRNDELHLVLVNVDPQTGTTRYYDLDKTGSRLKSEHVYTTDALTAAKQNSAGKPGSVVLVNTTHLLFDSSLHSTLVELMDDPEIHVVLIATVEGIEILQDYLLDSNVVIELSDKVESVSF